MFEDDEYVVLFHVIISYVYAFIAYCIRFCRSSYVGI